MERRYLSLMCSGLALLVLAWIGQALAVEDVPKRLPFDRYSDMMNKSPFAVASAPLTAAPTPNFAKDLYVANAARLKDGDMVTIQSATDRNLKEYLTTRGPNEHGYAITNIEWYETPARTKVTISKDGQVATIGFNQALMSQGLPNNGGQPPPPPSGAIPPPLPPAYVPPKPGMPLAVPTPPPHTRSLIERNPGNPSTSAAQPNSAALLPMDNAKKPK